MKTFRVAVVAVLVAAVFMGTLPFAAVAEAQSQPTFYTMYVDGMRVNGYPLIRDGVAYLPANTLAQVLSVNIRWDSRLNIVKVNDNVVVARPLSEEGRLYLPVEALAQSLGGSVDWDGRNHAIRVTSGSAAGAPSTAAVGRGLSNEALTAASLGTASVAAMSGASPIRVLPLPTSSAPPTASFRAPSVALAPAFPTMADPGSSAGSRYASGASQVPYPSPSAYPTGGGLSMGQSFTPMSGRPRLSENLEVPPPGTNTSLPPAVTPVYNSPRVFVPKSAQDNVFAVTVTNLESVTSIKDFYHPRPGYRFVIVYLSQQNVSNEVQIYTGRFSLLDQNNHSHDYVEALSNFWLVILRPFGINFGYLVFETPIDAQPTRLALHALNQAPLMVNL